MKEPIYLIYLYAKYDDHSINNMKKILSNYEWRSPRPHKHGYVFYFVLKSEDNLNILIYKLSKVLNINIIEIYKINDGVTRIKKYW